MTCGGKIGPYDCCTVVQGDCLELMKAIPDGAVDFIFTDPPYGHNNNNNGDLIHNREAALGKKKTSSSAARPIANDDAESAERVVRVAFLEFKRILKRPGCCCCCGGGGGPDPQFARWSLWLDEHITFKHAVVWDKGGLGMGWHYRRNYELVLVAQQPGTCRWYGGNDVPNVIRNIPKIIPSAEQHPTEKPPELAGFFMRLHSLEGELVLDPFTGHGSTLQAAARLGRHFLGFEISEEYCRIARERIALVEAQPSLFDRPAAEQLTLDTGRGGA